MLQRNLTTAEARERAWLAAARRVTLASAVLLLNDAVFQTRDFGAVRGIVTPENRMLWRYDVETACMVLTTTAT